MRAQFWTSVAISGNQTAGGAQVAAAASSEYLGSGLAPVPWRILNGCADIVVMLDAAGTRTPVATPTELPRLTLVTTAIIRIRIEERHLHKFGGSDSLHLQAINREKLNPTRLYG
jgi:hypothetical protein